MNRYSEYKDSGVEWIGEMPAHWATTKVKYESILSVQYGLNISSDKYLDSGVRFIRTTDIDDLGRLSSEGVYINSQEIKPDYITNKYDFLISRSGSLGKTYLHLDDDKLTYGGYLVRFNFGTYEKSKFFYYFSKSKNFFDWILINTIQSTIGNVNGEKYSNLIFSLPPYAEQIQISDYLDKKTSQIDSLVEKIERKIELLKEQRTSLINQCVTKGLNPDVEMKDSGVAWIGEIPKHWELKKLKYIVSYNTEVLTDKTDPSYEFTYVEIGNVDHIDGISYKSKIVFSDSPSRARRVLRNGDVIISTVRTYLRAIGLIDREDDLIGSTGFCVLRSSKEVSGKYLSYAVRSEWFISDVISNSEGVSYPGINSSDLVNLKVTFPPLNEQIEIENILDVEIKRSNDLISKETKRIELLKEYRQSLISSVVTGKAKITEEMI